MRRSWHCSSESQKLINKALAPEAHVLPLLALGTVVNFGLLTFPFQEDAVWVCFSLAGRRTMCRDVCEVDLSLS